MELCQKITDAIMSVFRHLEENGFTIVLDGRIIKAEWHESDHPRDDDGQFSSVEGESVSGPTKRNRAREELDERIQSGTVKTSVNTKRQNKHYDGSSEYKKAIKNGEHPSRLTLSLQETQKLINKYTKEGTAVKRRDGTIRVRFVHNHSIGTYVNQDGTISSQTSRGQIHYSKLGAHIVPDKPEEEE